MLHRILPGFLVRAFARPYVAGGSMEEGLQKADRLRGRRQLLATMDLLGEDVETPEQVRRSVEIYGRLIDALGDYARYPDTAWRPTVSLKPSMFTADGVEAAEAPIRELADRAREQGVGITIDMEDRRWTDFTIDLAVSLFQQGHDVGTVLQTRLHRTKADLDRVPPGMRLRLVIGIYPEPAEVAVTQKPAMKERMLEHAAHLLERGARVEFGTHDVAFLERFVRDVAPAAPERCELQMLLGVPRSGFVDRLRKGDLGPVLPVRIYIPFAESWSDATAYLRRRMRESPSMMWLVLRNLRPVGRR